MEDNNDILFWKNLGDELKAEDKDQFINDLQQSGDINRFEQTKKIWEATGNIYNSRLVNKKLAWDNIENKLEPTPFRQQRYFLPLLKIAAGIVLLATLSFFAIRLIPARTITIATTNKMRQIELPDGSLVWLNSNSSLQYPRRFKAHQRNVELVGEAFFNVAPNENSPFTIHCLYANVRVLGTSFNLQTHTNGNQLKLSVVTGKVLLTPLDKRIKPGIITKGQNCVLTLSTNKLVVSNQIPVNTNSWKTGRLVFHNTPLVEVAATLTEHYKHTITLSDSGLNNILFTAEFNNEKLDNIIEMIDYTLDMHHQVKGDSIIIDRRSTSGQQ